MKEKISLFFKRAVEKWFLTTCVASFFIGIIISLLFGRSIMLPIIAFVVGILLFKFSLFKKPLNITQLLVAALFCLGLITFSFVISRIIIFFIFFVGFLIGKYFFNY